MARASVAARANSFSACCCSPLAAAMAANRPTPTVISTQSPSSRATLQRMGGVPRLARDEVLRGWRGAA